MQTVELTPVRKIERDMIKAIRNGVCDDNVARYLVDLYYSMQKSRIIANNQLSALKRDAKKSGKDADPHDAFEWVLEQSRCLEDEVRLILKAFATVHPMAWFFDNTIGIGPVLAAGLVAHIDITKAPTAGHIWSFAGLDPRVKWEKGKKRPFNAALKTLCWKVGDSFVKQSTRVESLYGRVYRERKEYEVQKTENGEHKEQATKILEEKRIGKTTEAYKAYKLGKLPAGHLDARARRYTVKLFLSHLHECWYEQEVGKPVKPFAIGILNHAHYIPAPQREGRG